MAKFLSQYSKWIIAVFGFLVFGLSQTGLVKNFGLWEDAEGKLIDFRYQLRGERPADPDIQLVGVENSSFQLDALSTNEIAASPTLQLMQNPPPWDRRIYAAILEKLMGAGAKVVMFDFVFSPITEGDPVFAQALLKYKDRVVIGEAFSEDEDAGGNSKKLNVPNDSLMLPGAESVVGLVNFFPDSDDVFRRGKYHTSIEKESGIEGFPDDLIHITVVAVKKFTGQVIMPPIGAPNYFDYQGRAGTYRPVPVENMFVDELWTNPPFNGGLTFSNKIVIVGPMAELYHDIHPTPFGEMPGPEIQAQVTAGILRGTWLMGTSTTVDIALALLMLWLAMMICLRIDNALWKVFLLAASLVIFFVASQITFTHYKIVLPMMQPIFCLVVPGTFGVIFQYALEQFERLRMRNLLGRYVSENVAKKISEDQRSFEERVKGQKQPVTILFSDIRGFTSMTETVEADKLVAQLNEYFLEMVGIVMKEGGTLQKFIGDAIMAAWGDTHSESLEGDAARAVRAALQMRPALKKLNESWKDNPDRKELSIGVGVNHGDVIVGEIGHPRRMEFTVLGDGVNLAARLESATKQFHADILIGEQTEKLTRDKFIFRSVGAIAFKGKTQPIEVFMLLGDRSQPAPAWYDKYESAVKLYRGRKFSEAAALFETVQKEIGAEDYLCKMYLEPCGIYAKNPPPADWDGSFKLSEK